MTLIANAVASHIVVDKNGKARGVHYFDRETRASREVFGKVLVLCASTLESTRLLLNSRSRFHPEGLGNSHDVLGRYLMDHTIRVGAGGILEVGEGSGHKLGRRAGERHLYPAISQSHQPAEGLYSGLGLPGERHARHVSRTTLEIFPASVRSTRRRSRTTGLTPWASADGARCWPGVKTTWR